MFLTNLPVISIVNFCWYKMSACPGFESGSPHSLLNGARKYDCVSLEIKNLSMWGVSAWVKNNLKKDVGKFGGN
jgi:hypothetical protein